MRLAQSIVPLLLVASLAYGEASIPALSRPVVDEAGLLSAQDRAEVESALLRLEQSGKAQMVVHLPSSLGGQDIESFSIAVAEKWKVGKKKKDNGVILIIAPNERRMRLEVGYGLEGDLPDIFAKRLLENVVKPRFREQQYRQGILEAVDTIEKRLADPTVLETSPEHASFKWIPLVLFLLFILLILGASVGSMFGGRRYRRTWYGGGWDNWGGGEGGGGGGWGGSSGGGFSGGGGSFGGGGASSSW